MRPFWHRHWLHLTLGALVCSVLGWSIGTWLAYQHADDPTTAARTQPSTAPTTSKAPTAVPIGENIWPPLTERSTPFATSGPPAPPAQ